MVLNATTRSALAKGGDARQIASGAAEMLASQGTGGSLGFVYATDTLKARLPEVTQRLRELTGVEDWVGAVGLGVMSGRQAAFGEPAIAVMIVNWPKEQYKLFQGVPSEPWPPPATGPLGGMVMVLVHADPRNHSYPDLLRALSAASGAYLIGGVTASRDGYCDQVAGSALAEGGISGVLAGPKQRFAS